MSYTKAFHILVFISSLLIISPIASPQPAVIDHGEIHGAVYRGHTGEALANAAVQLAETGQRTLTDEKGEFGFGNLPAGEYTLTATAAGYRPLEDEVVVFVRAGQTADTKISLVPVGFVLEEVEVKSAPSPPTVGKQTLRSAEMRRIPGTAGDPLRALGTMPGIGVANDFDSTLYIRGGAPEDNRFYLDGSPLAYPFHFGGLVSSVSSEVIEKIDVHAGGFGAEYGSDAQAVIDISSRRGRQDRLGGKFNLNLLYSEGLVEGPIGKRGSWYLAGRRSYFDLLPIEVEDITAFPRFWDYQAKFSYDLGEQHQLHVNAFAADDLMELKFDLEDVDNDPTLAGRFHFKYRFDVQGVHLNSTLSDRLTSKLSISRASYLQDIDMGQGYFLRLQPTQYELREDLAYRLMQKHQIETGLLLSTAEWGVSSLWIRPPDEGDPNLQSAQFFTFGDKVASDFRQRFSFIEGYVQNRYTPLPFLSVALGLRLDYFDTTDRLSVGPRGSLRLTLPGNSELRLAVGRYDTSPYPWQISQDFGNPDVEASTAIHYIMEVERQLSPQTSLKVAGYQKDFQDLITRDQQLGYLNQGEGFARGVELSVNHQVAERFLGRANYAYALARRKDRPSAPERLYSFDQTHVATFTGSYQLTPTWEIGAKWQYRTGNPYTPVVSTELVSHPMTHRLVVVPVYGEINSARVSPFHRLDIRVSKSFMYEKWKMGVYLEVLNVYNRKNMLSFDYNEDYTEQEKVNQLPLIPYLGMTVEF